MSKTAQIEYTPVDASPVKSFFVHMLTRDIKLEEAILDLLDNCVDGILRSEGTNSKKEPYSGFWAEIEFKKDSFSISDNCGGIPWNLHDYAFRMGRRTDRPPDTPGTVGIYGIGRNAYRNLQFANLEWEPPKDIDLPILSTRSACTFSTYSLAPQMRVRFFGSR